MGASRADLSAVACCEGWSAKVEPAVSAIKSTRQITSCNRLACNRLACNRLAVSRRSRRFAVGHGGTAPWLQVWFVNETVERVISVIALKC